MGPQLPAPAPSFPPPPLTSPLSISPRPPPPGEGAPGSPGPQTPSGPPGPAPRGLVPSLRPRHPAARVGAGSWFRLGRRRGRVARPPPGCTVRTAPGRARPAADPDPPTACCPKHRGFSPFPRGRRRTSTSQPHAPHPPGPPQSSHLQARPLGTAPLSPSPAFPSPGCGRRLGLARLGAGGLRSPRRAGRRPGGRAWSSGAGEVLGQPLSPGPGPA